MTKRTKKYSDKNYFRSSDGNYLHQDIWEEHNGKIPEGYVVHHKYFDSLNNDIKNLEIIPVGEHISLHRRAQEKQKESAKDTSAQNESEKENAAKKQRDTSERPSVQENIENGKRAIQKILADHSDVKAAMYCEETGDIDFVYGKESTAERDYENGYGIAKILKKHGQKAVDMIPEVIAKGKSYQKYDDRIHFDYGDYTAVVKMDFDGQKRTWLVTNFQKYENKKDSHDAEDFARSASTTRNTDSITGENLSAKNIPQTENENNDYIDETEKFIESGAFDVSKKGNRFVAELTHFSNATKTQKENFATLAKNFGGRADGEGYSFKTKKGRDDFVRAANGFLQAADAEYSLRNVLTVTGNEKAVDKARKIGENGSTNDEGRVTVTGDEFGDYKDIKELRAKAKKYYKEHLQGTSVENPILGKVNLDDIAISFTGRGITKAISTSAKKNKVLLIKHLPQLIKNATDVEASPNIKNKRNASQYTYLHTTAMIDGKRQAITITIFTDVNGNRYYNHVIDDEETEKKNNKGLPVYSAQAPKNGDGTPTVRQSSVTDNIPQSEQKGNTTKQKSAKRTEKRGAFSSPKWSKQGDVQKALRNAKIVADENLTPQQKQLASFADEMHTPLVFIKTVGNLHGFMANGVSYINVNSEMDLPKTFWHENFHWLKNNNRDLYDELLSQFKDRESFGAKQLEAWRTKKGRHDLTDEETIEEMLADEFVTVKGRYDAMQHIAKKNPSLVERFVAWIKGIMERFANRFNGRTREAISEGKLTPAQLDAFTRGFGEIAARLVDNDGKRIFKTYNDRRIIKLANGKDLPDVSLVEKFSASLDKRAIYIQNKNAAKSGEGVAMSDNEKLSPKDAVIASLQSIRNKEITNKSTGIVAILNRDGISKMVSNVAVNKSIRNGYTQGQHLEAAKNIKQLFENASLTVSEQDKNNNPDILSFKRFHCDTIVMGKEARAKISVKEGRFHGHRIYSVELEQLEKPSGLKKRTDTISPKGSEGLSQKGGQVSTTHGGKPSSFLASNITQQETKGKDENQITNTSRTDARGGFSMPKFSMGTEERTEHTTAANESFFKKAWNNLAKKMHLKGDKIVTVAEQEERIGEKQNAAMEKYLNAPTKENRAELKRLGITNAMLDAYEKGEDYNIDVGLIRGQAGFGSPSEIAERVALFRTFFKMGDRSAKKLVRLRSSFERKVGEVMKKLKTDEEHEELSSILWAGDRERKEYTKEELTRSGVAENVADAYVAIRQQFRRAYGMLNNARRGATTKSKRMSAKETEKLKQNKFVEIMHEAKTADEHGERLIFLKNYEKA